MSNAPAAQEALVLSRRGLPLPQAEAALPRAPWWPAMLRSRAAPVVTSRPEGRLEFDEDASVVDAPAVPRGEKDAWRNEAFALSYPDLARPAAQAAGEAPPLRLAAEDAVTRSTSAPVAAVGPAAPRAMPMGMPIPMPKAATDPDGPSQQPTRIERPASAPEQAGVPHTVTAGAGPLAVPRVASAASVIAPGPAVASMPAETASPSRQSAPPAERWPRTALASRPSTPPTFAPSQVPIAAADESPRAAFPPARDTTPAPTVPARVFIQAAGAAPRTASATSRAGKGPAAVAEPVVMLPPAAMGWPQVPGRDRSTTAPSTATPPVLTETMRQALLAPPRAEPQGVHIGQVHVTVQAPATASRGTAVAAPAPQPAAPAAQALQPAPFRSPWAGAYRRRD